MSMANGLNGVESGRLDVDNSHLRRERSQQGMKFSLYPSRSAPRPRTASNTNTSGPSSPTLAHHPHSQNSPLPSRADSLPTHNPDARRPSTSHQHHTNTNETPRSFATPPHVQQSLHKRPSEASRLRALNNGYRSHSTEGRHTPEPATTVDNFSRPRQPSVKRKNDSPKPLLQNSTTFPLRSHNEEQPIDESSAPRDRGMSASSSKSSINTPAVQLRPSMSIPDYQTADSIYSRQRNLNNSSYRPAKVLSRPDSNYSAHRRDPMGRSTAQDDEEVRASFRSALTTNSSFLGTSGTERSSIMTKSSSATSIFGRDEGMSVDDAIGMYEGGFQDSGTEGDYGTRPRSVDSEQRITRLGEAMNDSLNVPSYFVARDSATMFQIGAMNTPSPQESSAASGANGTLEVQESYFEQKAPSRPPTRAAPTSWDGTRDRYGFRKNTQHVPVEKYEIWNGPYTEHLARRRKKWVALMKDNGLSTDNPKEFPPKSIKVKRFVRKGIPPDWRGAAWFFYAGGPTMVANHMGVYNELVLRAAAGQVSETDDEIIERDLNRTFPDNIKFKPDPSPDDEPGVNPEAETPLLQSLRRVLQAFSIYNPRIGYCQSLNFLAGLLLLFMDEEKSFWMLNIITRVYLPGTHEVNLEGANVDLGVLMTSVKDMMPAIWAKIGGELDGSAGDGNVSMRLPPITLCTTAWFMSCFIGTLPIETTLRVWDSFFYEGSKTLFRIALTIFKVGEAEIKAVSDPMEIFQVVQTIPRKLVDANALMDACFRRRNGFGHLSQETIEKGRAQRRKGYADERAKAAGELASSETVNGMARKGTIFGRKKSKGGGAPPATPPVP
ncbi:hypothetical protein G7Y89_g11668 [Cudoniella acicularis]|uniref:Rab-GAP TBC domain-containing protein n=1 Tax=Cudoniella acicularis TaxID=354080 RepID=A0A8H4RBY0_9HELO|nr:hypothetical protein G7Y89_g11668 [Cudoniella acicularis]